MVSLQPPLLLNRNDKKTNNFKRQCKGAKRKPVYKFTVSAAYIVKTKFKQRLIY